MTNHNHRTSLFGLAAVLAAAVLATPGQARAERKRNALDGKPAVRHRLLLVKNRFEIAPAFESTVNADFKHTLSGGLKLEYHFSDMWSLGAVGFFGTGLDTGLNTRIVDTLPDDVPEGDPTPTQNEWLGHLNTMPIHGAAYVSLTPWYGKLAAFGKFFVNFDFYFSGGLAMAQLANCTSGNCQFDEDPDPDGDVENNVFPDDDPNNDPALNSGTRYGIYLGGGIHVFMSNWIALDLTVRNYMFSDNPSGLDFNADLLVSEDDDRFLSHLFMGVGVSMFLPSSVKRTN
jgi:outer membrane beta-barrel protein